jgi:hypothetical protein
MSRGFVTGIPALLYPAPSHPAPPHPPLLTETPCILSWCIQKRKLYGLRDTKVFRCRHFEKHESYYGWKPRVSCPQNYEISRPFTGYLAVGTVSKIVHQVPAWKLRVEFARILRNPNTYCGIHKSSSLAPILSHTNTVNHISFT